MTDVAEEDIEIHKVYLSVILDLHDRHIVSFVIEEHNDQTLVFKPFEKAIKANPNATPIFHPDRGFQYTSVVFYHKLEKVEMTQSMSWMAKYIDNEPMKVSGAS